MWFWLSHYSDYLLLCLYCALLQILRYHLETVLDYTEDHQVNYWYKLETKGDQGCILVEQQQEHHSRTNVDHWEQLFLSAILRNQLKFSKEVHWSHFAPIYECDFYARSCQMHLKYQHTMYFIALIQGLINIMCYWQKLINTRMP